VTNWVLRLFFAGKRAPTVGVCLGGTRRLLRQCPGWVMRWWCVSDELGAEAILAGKRAPTVGLCLAGTVGRRSYKGLAAKRY
jgi:hypothetical protein